MRGLVPAFLAGFASGLAFGLLLLEPVQAALGFPQPFAAGVAAAVFAGGLLLGRGLAPKPREVRLTGRVFDFPQGPVMVEAALRRAKSILPTKVVERE